MPSGSSIAIAGAFGFSSKSTMKARQLSYLKKIRRCKTRLTEGNSFHELARVKSPLWVNRTRWNRVFAFSRSMAPNREFSARRGSPYPDISVLNVLDRLDSRTLNLKIGNPNKRCLCRASQIKERCFGLLNLQKQVQNKGCRKLRNKTSLF